MAVHDQERAAMFDGVARSRRQIGRRNIELDLRHAPAGRCGGDGAEIGIGVFQCLLRHRSHSLERMDWPPNAEADSCRLCGAAPRRQTCAEASTKSPPIQRFPFNPKVNGTRSGRLVCPYGKRGPVPQDAWHNERTDTDGNAGAGRARRATRKKRAPRRRRGARITVKTALTSGARSARTRAP